MSRHLLFYAGMADDLVNEQIGLAVSDDGRTFSRVGADGLVLARDEAVEWRALRVCNPTVLFDVEGFTMYYQGVAAGPHEAQHTSIGVARSSDGMRWSADPNPILPWAAMAELDPALDEQRRVCLVEPTVIDGRMWFVYRHASTPGNALVYAEADSSRAWHIREVVLRGSQFPGMDLHYPYVERKDDGLVLYFTLRDSRQLHGIFRMHSSDGLAWHALEPVLPRSGELKPSLALRTMWHLPPAIRYRIFSGEAMLGYAHPHVIENGSTSMYYQRANLGPRGVWLDIARCELVAGGRCRSHSRVLAPSERPGAWDSYFVADPYIVVLPAPSAA